MSKEFRPWKIDEAQLLPPSVQDYVPRDHVSRLIVSLVRESLDLSAIIGSYRSGLGQPPFDPRMMTALLLHGYASGIYSSRRIARAAVECLPTWSRDGARIIYQAAYGGSTDLWSIPASGGEPTLLTPKTGIVGFGDYNGSPRDGGRVIYSSQQVVDR